MFKVYVHKTDAKLYKISKFLGTFLSNVNYSSQRSILEEEYLSVFEYLSNWK